MILIALINLITAYLKKRQEKYNNRIENKLSGMVLQSLNAISKIKIAGAEVRILINGQNITGSSNETRQILFDFSSFEQYGNFWRDNCFIFSGI